MSDRPTNIRRRHRATARAQLVAVSIGNATIATERLPAPHDANVHTHDIAIVHVRLCMPSPDTSGKLVYRKKSMKNADKVSER
jgi:hypothetical protein